MNSVNLQQAGGFPLETDTLNFMQNTYQFLQAFAAIVGDNYILSGCAKTGSNVGDGVVVIAGEILEFRGGAEQSKIIVRQESTSRTFENGQVKEVYTSRYATFGSGVGSLAWNSLQRFKTLLNFKDLPNQTSNDIDLDNDEKLATAKAVKLLNDKVDALLPAGIIVKWAGSIANIPEGYALCDGQDGRPDLRDKFILGAGSLYPVGAVGGAANKTLSENNLPEFNLAAKGFQEVSNTWKSGGTASPNNATGHETVRVLTYPGQAQPFSILPPYYALAYIQKI